MTKIALFPGSFDPFTIGHESVVRRALPLFDKIIVAVGYNTNKRGFFPLEKRVKWIKDVFEDESKIEIKTYEGLTVLK
jgi:pantetheine-phosphate adenylyltransferase